MLVLRCGLAGVVWYPDADFSLHTGHIGQSGRKCIINKKFCSVSTVMVRWMKMMQIQEL